MDVMITMAQHNGHPWMPEGEWNGSARWMEAGNAGALGCTGRSVQQAAAEPRVYSTSDAPVLFKHPGGKSHVAGIHCHCRPDGRRQDHGHRRPERDSAVRTEAQYRFARHSKALTTVALDYGEITWSGHDLRACMACRDRRALRLHVKIPPADASWAHAVAGQRGPRSHRRP